jgi:2-haloacid dehalogenase
MFADLLSMEPFKKFKPAPEVYHYLAGKTGIRLEEIWLVSSNPFDIIGGAQVGLNTAWVDRACRGWQDAVLPTLPPKVVDKGIDEVLVSIIRQSAQWQAHL